MKDETITKLCKWSLKQHDVIASYWRTYHWLFAFTMMFFAVMGTVDIMLAVNIIAGVCLSTNGFLYLLIKFRKNHIKAIDNVREKETIHKLMIDLIKRKEGIK